MFSALWSKPRDEWLATNQAGLVFLACSVLTLFLTPVFLGYVSNRGGTPLFELGWGIVGALGAPATLFLWVGMWRYWARLDRSGKWTRRLWFVVLLFGFWYGSVVYCYFAFLPQVWRTRRI